jgi:hypothetical protein
MAYEISTTTEIAAPPEQVWAVLADLASYPHWHPVFRKVSGQLAVGSKLTITTTTPNGRTMTARVTVVAAEPGRELRWVSKLLGITISQRSFLLSKVDGGTLLVQAGTYRGLSAFGGRGSGRGTGTVLINIQGTLDAINQAIKEQAEARQRTPG